MDSTTALMNLKAAAEAYKGTKAEHQALDQSLAIMQNLIDQQLSTKATGAKPKKIDG